MSFLTGPLHSGHSVNGKRILKREQVKTDIRPVNVQLVGRYAVQVSWSDGHQTGMYHFEKLFEMCGKHGARV